MKNEEKINILKLSVEELRRMHDELCDTYTSAKNKILAFLAGELGFLSYLYYGGNLFFPQQIYGQIFYFIGIALLLIALAILFIAVQPVVWVIPTETKVHKDSKYVSYENFLQYIKDQYVEAFLINNAHCSKKHKLLNMAFYLLVIGATLLSVIKNFNK